MCDTLWPLESHSPRCFVLSQRAEWGMGTLAQYQKLGPKPFWKQSTRSEPPGANVIMIAIVRAERLRRVIRFALASLKWTLWRRRAHSTRPLQIHQQPRRGLILSTSAPGKMPRSLARAVTCPINSAPCSQTQINGDTANWEISLINKVDAREMEMFRSAAKHFCSHVGIVSGALSSTLSIDLENYKHQCNNVPRKVFNYCGILF
jgi:hypothetical protein